MAQVTPPAPVDPSQLSQGQFSSTVILNNIFSMILSMVGTLQNAAASQASRLKFMATWQQQYTELAAAVPTLVQGEGPFGSTNQDTVRGEINSLAANITATIQNRQSVVSDNAKALQSNVNQSNDAVNQQSNLATAIIQELSTLLAAIFK